jgi:hypothetical protein
MADGKQALPAAWATRLAQWSLPPVVHHPQGVDEAVYITPWSTALVTEQQSSALQDTLEAQYIKMQGPCLREASRTTVGRGQEEGGGLSGASGGGWVCLAVSIFGEVRPGTAR